MNNPSGPPSSDSTIESSTLTQYSLDDVRSAKPCANTLESLPELPSCTINSAEPSSSANESEPISAPQDNPDANDKQLEATMARQQALSDKKQRDGIISNAEEAELAGINAFQESPAAAKLYAKSLLGTLSKEEKAQLIAWNEFAEPQASGARDLVSKEVLGALNNEEHAKLAGWREFPVQSESRARDLVSKEFRGQINKEESAELSGIREFPIPKVNGNNFTEARELSKKEALGSLLPAETKKLADFRELPHVPVWKQFAIVAEDDDKPAKPNTDTRAERIAKIAANEFPKDLHGQDLVQKYMLGKLNRFENAELKGLREFPKDKAAQQLVQREHTGKITPAEKATLNAYREFHYDDANNQQGRVLAAKETLGIITKAEKGELVGRREFQSELDFVGKVSVPRGAVELVQKEFLGNITAIEKTQLHQARLKYKADIAKLEAAPPPKP